MRFRFLFALGVAVGVAAPAGAALAVSGSSTVTRFAGPKSYAVKPGFSGDGGPAIAANLNIFGNQDEGNQLAIDGKGNLFIADSGNHRVRMIDKAGKITTFA